MKKILKLFTFLLLAFVFGTNAYANKDTVYKYAEDIKSGSYSSDTTFGENASSEAASALNPQNLFIYMLDTVKSILSGSMPQVFTLFAVIILAAFTGVFSENLGSASKITDYVSILSLVLICFNMVSPLILSVTEFISEHTAFMVSVSGSSGILLMSSGSFSGSTAGAVSASFITAFTELCASGIILPTVKLILMLSAMQALSKSMELSGIIGFLKSFCTYGTGLLFMLFLSVHSFTVSIAGNADTLAIKSIRFTFARLIPVAGNLISESMKTVVSGMNFIKSACGGIGIAYIIYTVLPGIVSVMALKAVFTAGSSLSDIFGLSRHSAFLKGLNNACSLLFAICVFAAFGGIIILAVFMNTALTI